MKNKFFNKTPFSKKTESVISESKNSNVTKITPSDKKALKILIREAMKSNGNNCDLNFIDVSLVEDMSSLFFHSKFNGSVSEWDVSGVKKMTCMFACSAFRGDLSKWKVSSSCETTDVFFLCDIPQRNIPKSLL